MKSNLAEQMTMTGSATEHWMTSWDGTQLFYRAWLPATHPKQAVVLFHRGHEHSGRLHELASALDMPHTAVFAWDARGHGRSPGERGYAPSFSCFVKDAEAFVRHLSETYRIPINDMAVVGQSVGSVIVATWVHDYAPPIRAMVLAVPAFRVKLYVPFAIPGLRLMQSMVGQCFVKSYVKAKLLTHDKEQARLYSADPLIERAIAVNILLGLRDTSTRIVADAGAIRTPTLVFVAQSDWVVEQGVQKTFFERLSSATKELCLLPGFFHDVFHEKDRDIPISKTRQFLSQVFEHPRAIEPLLEAHQKSYTRTEYDALSKPLSPWSPKYWSFLFQQMAMQTIGRLSEGVRISWRTGFDSGESLNYVYANQAKGTTAFGRILDRLYLDSIGWKGIRQRKMHIERVLDDAITRVAKSHGSVHIVDIAAGPGRYILDTIRSRPDVPMTALLRDRSAAGLSVGRHLAESLEIRSVRYEEGDAFDQQSLASLNPRPSIVVVSGLYELFPDNNIILRSLRGLFTGVQPGGYLIYTNQPWHPQVEMIARVLTNRDHHPWIMRRRTQEEMDDLVKSAGFEKLSMVIDDFGIFSVSMARKNS